VPHSCKATSAPGKKTFLNSRRKARKYLSQFDVDVRRLTKKIFLLVVRAGPALRVGQVLPPEVVPGDDPAITTGRINPTNQ
jgi:hypothetical protein